MLAKSQSIAFQQHNPDLPSGADQFVLTKQFSQRLARDDT